MIQLVNCDTIAFVDNVIASNSIDATLADLYRMSSEFQAELPGQVAAIHNVLVTKGGDVSECPFLMSSAMSRLINCMEISRE